MCTIGAVLGLAVGAAQTAGQVSAANQNNRVIEQQARLEQAEAQRKFLVESDASNKDAFQASLEADRAKSFINATGGGQGATAGLRIGEQSRQGALSIANARDRKSAAGANYIAAGKNTQIGAQNRIAANSVSPMAAFTNIATAGISNYGAFK